MNHPTPMEPPGGKCGAKNRSGGTCGKPAGWGTDSTVGRCRLHGGATPSGKKNAARLESVALAQVYGMPVETSHEEALEHELHRAAGIVAWLSSQVAALTVDEATGPVGNPEHYNEHKPHVWIGLLGTERDRLARVIRLCHDVGMDERRVRVAEQMGGMLAEIIGGILSDLGVADDPRAPDIVRRRLTLLPGGDDAA